MTIMAFTAEKMTEIANGVIVDADLIDGHLILQKEDETIVDAGFIIGDQGEQGPPGDTGDTGGTGPAGLVICTSSTRPSGGALYEGLGIWETDTKKLLVYNGVRFDPPWSMPWGVIDHKTTTTLQSGITTEVTLSFSSSTITYVANRKIRFKAQTNWYSSVAGDSAMTYLKESSTYLNQVLTRDLGGTSGQMKPNVNEIVLSPTAGSHTYIIRGERFSGTGNLVMRAFTAFPPFFLIEDIGPAGPPV